MTSTLIIAVAQLNPTVGDIGGNLALVREARKSMPKVDLLVTTELMVSGYPPEDLVLQPAFLDAVEEGVRTFAREMGDGPAILLGTPWREAGQVYNALLLVEGGHIVDKRFKHHLPNYGVFDEKRIFASAPLQPPLPFRGYSLGIVICEDMWLSDVSAALAGQGAQILIVPNASPYEIDKANIRSQHAVARVRETGLPLLYVNQIGGQDELVFDGSSFVVDGKGTVSEIAPAFENAVVETEWQLEEERLRFSPLLHGRGRETYGVAISRTGEGVPQTANPPQPTPSPQPSPMRERENNIYRALVLGLRDYVEKNRFPGVILGLSGGIDSAVVAAIAVDALGPGRVRAVMMPSPYTSVESLENAAKCAQLLGIALDTISIEPGMAAITDMLTELPGVTGENVQSRLRGMTLMALSNRDGAMVLSTGNKSEMAVGYATLYGDMCGGYAVLKDVYKTQVFQLARWRNAQSPVMPESIITKPPSAELKPNQTDQDTLPPYDVLDAILQGLIEGQGAVQDHDPALVARIRLMLDRAEYKRRQAPPGPKITPRAFGKERRMPITNGFVPVLNGKV